MTAETGNAAEYREKTAAGPAGEDIRLTRFLSDGAVLQQNKPIPVRGKAQPGTCLHVLLLPEGEERPELCRPAEGGQREVRRAQTLAGADGRFLAVLDPLPAGGPYSLTVCDEEGRCAAVRDILIGAVWYVSGQSNIDVDMERCGDSYPEILRDCTDDGIRSFRVTENPDYHGPIEEPLTGEWRKAELNSILKFSATGYFYARALREMTGVPVGILQASLGGSRITSWMSREMLQGEEAYRPLLEEMDRYADDSFRGEILRRNETAPAAWHEELDRTDAGNAGRWQEHPEEILEKGTALELPCYFRDTQLKDFIGALWLAREFTVPEEMAGHSAGLWLGTMVDSDVTYVNGVRVGETGYQYPPRKYRIPEGILRTGRNRIVIRLVVENGKGRVTPGKGYYIYNDQGVIDLRGSWSCRIGAACGAVPPTDFVSWKAGGLFNGTAAPCCRFPAEGMVWYQGEANTHEPYDYKDLLKRYAEGYRVLRQEPELPFYYVQLPNYDVSMDGDASWAPLRERQRLAAQEIAHAGMAVTMDLGEDNDLHPHGKREIGRRLALMAAHDLYGAAGEYTGPVPEHAVLSGRNPGTVVVELSHAAGVHADSCGKGQSLRDAEVVAESGAVYPASAELVQGRLLRDGTGEKETDGSETAAACLLIRCEDETVQPAKVRFGFHSVLKGALIYNRAGLPMSPFELKVERKGEF